MFDNIKLNILGNFVINFPFKNLIRAIILKSIII